MLQKLNNGQEVLGNGFEKLFNEIVGFPEKGLNFSKKMNFHLPKANIIRKEDSYEIHLSVPGWKKEDFSITVQNSELKVGAKTTIEETREEHDFTHQEFSQRSFQRVFNLAEDVEENKISATYEDGILKLSIPKNKKAIDRELVKEIKVS